jgi:hypothetical protein
MRSLYLILLTFLFYIDTAAAYVGPGLGLGVIGALVGVIVTVLLALLGIFWYPLKRMLKKNNTKNEQANKSDEL